MQRLVRHLSMFALTVGTLGACTVLGDESPLATPAAGPSFPGQLISASPSWKLRFAVDDNAREIAAADLAMWGSFVEPARGTRIILSGGGVIAAEALRIDQETLQGKAQSFSSVSIPLDFVAGIIFRPPIDRTKADQLLLRIASTGMESDRVVLDNGDELSGNVASLNDAALVLESDAGKIDIEIGKISAVIFNPTLIKQIPTNGLRANVGFRDGSRFAVNTMTADKASASLELVGGAKLKCSTAAIVAIQPLGGRIDYLSDLKPLSYRHLPYLLLSWPFHADRSTLGGQLRARGKVYPKGLGMHSPSRITYELSRPYRQFQAELAVDDETEGRGSVVFRVFADNGDGSWQERSTSEIIRGGEPPVPITVNLVGAKRISLLVDYADRGDELDHADWLNARLVR